MESKLHHLGHLLLEFGHILLPLLLLELPLLVGGEALEFLLELVLLLPLLLQYRILVLHRLLLRLHALSRATRLVGLLARLGREAKGHHAVDHTE